VFLSGVLLGPASGARVGALAATVFGLVNPYGLPDPLLLTALIVSRTLIGALGGALRGVLQRGPRLPRMAIFLVAAIVATLVFQGLTNAAIGLTFGNWRAVLVGAVPFALVNLLANSAAFVLLGVSAVDVARRLPLPSQAPEEDG